jgi:hypothetical protein
MKIIFYKGWEGTITDKAICLWTLGRYSHLEIVGSDGYCYSASSRDGGVRRKKINYENSDKWDIFDLQINEDFLSKFFEETKHCKYDWVGIFLYHFLPFRIEDNKKWYCSEWISEILQHSGYPMKTNLTPSGVFRNLKNLWGI